MISKAKKVIALVADFYETKLQKKSAEKKYEKLKAEVKSIMDGARFLIAGKHKVDLTECTRTSLDKEKILAENGQDFVDDNSKTTTYDEISCEKIS